MNYSPEHHDSASLSKFDYANKKELYNKIKYLMILRVFVITIFMVGALFLFWGEEKSILEEDEMILWIFFGLIIFLYLLTIIYSLFLNKINNLRAFAYFQITGDILFETGLIYISGAIFSPLSFLYILSIITASILLYTYGAYFIASISCIAYGSMAAFSQNNIFPRLDIFFYSNSIFSTGEVLYKLFVNFCAFYLVAYLSNYLIEGLRKAGEELDTRQENISRLQKLNENILRSIESGVMTVDLDGAIVSFNLAAERITGYSEQEVLEKVARDIFPLAVFQDTLTPTNYSERFKRYEHRFINKAGVELFLGFSRSFLFDEHGRNTGYIIIFQDLTEFKKLEDAKKRADKMAILGELAARMAHEIRNPLTSMRGSIEVISKEPSLNSTNRRLMDIVLRESDRLNRLISDFLQYAQPRKLISRRFSISNLIQETIILLKNHPKMSENIQLQVDLSPEDIYISGDMFQIKQVLLNLCLNALDAMPTGGTLALSLQLPIPVKQLEKSDIISHNGVKTYLSLHIQDFGKGILPEYKSQIFTPFFSTKEGGTGLGLAIAYRVIEEHQGFIDYHTEVDAGTTFTVYLPLDTDILPDKVEGKTNEQYISG
ncbi:nitrogen regulation protein NR(II) [candidate division CSSED10-310 bacterium]|uniref:histidine kinase n=1 Tax=candidate division CSSED10-310 bacterium TaxID=2855610 RepID=A0ABV6YW76_UNCC1